MQISYTVRHTSVVFSCLVCATSWAQDTPRVQVTANYTVQAEDNLFRLPDGANTNALVGRSSSAEQIGISTLGLAFHTEQGLQKFELNASLVDYRYQNFEYLSFTARNYAAAWRWALTPRLTGNITTDRKETLSSFADNRTFNAPNQRLETHTRVDAEYEIDGPWHVLAGVGKSRQSNLQSAIAGEDYSSDSADVGVRYDYASGSTMKYSVKVSDGTYLNRVAAPGSFVDDKFQQVDNDARLHWKVSAVSAADIHVTHIKRTHPVYGQRDFSGFNVGAGLNWSLSEKTTLLMGYAHDLAAYATTNTNYSQTDRLSLGVAWQTSAKTVLRLRQEWAQIDYLGSPSPGQSSQRQDISRDSTLSWSWQPRTQWTLNASLQHLSRGSNLAGLDYTSNVAMLSGQFSY